MKYFLCVSLLLFPFIAAAEIKYPTVTQTSEEASGIFWFAVEQEECKKAFFDATGNTLEYFLGEDEDKSNDVEMVFISPWPFGDTAGICACGTGLHGEARIALNVGALYGLGPWNAANTMVHELVHAANCGKGLDICDDQKIACEVSEACVSTGADCKKYFRRCKERQSLSIRYSLPPPTVFYIR